MRYTVLSSEWKIKTGIFMSLTYILAFVPSYPAFKIV